MTQDTPPSDDEVLATLAGTAGGLTPAKLLEALCASEHSVENAIIAIQRVFDRGLVELSEGAKLIVVEELGIAA